MRVSGARAVPITAALLTNEVPLEPRRATLVQVVDSEDGGRALDQVMATYFPRPGSYTGEDVVEISGHGSPVLLQQIVTAAMGAGARLAEPGEFTFRAFLNGRMDLIQAEAVGDLINAVTPLQARVAFDQLEGTVTMLISEIDATVFDLIARLEASLDFPDEGYHFVKPAAVRSETRGLADRISAVLAAARTGQLVREGCEVVVLGKPNVGKSTLFNRLLGSPRAIVNKVAGTTRDLLTETVDVDGIPVTLVDTAGIRQTDDPIEAEGVQRARGALSVAAIAIVVLDRSRPIEPDDYALLEETAGTDRLIVINKIDLPACWSSSDESELWGNDDEVAVSLVRDDGLPALRLALVRVLWKGEQLRDTAAVTNIRHISLLKTARAALMRASNAAERAVAEELVLADLQDARHALEEISGRRTPDAVMERIFDQFCIGK